MIDLYAQADVVKSITSINIEPGKTFEDRFIVCLRFLCSGVEVEVTIAAGTGAAPAANKKTEA